MNIDITVIVALITAIAAIVAPVITAVVNSRSALKIKKLDTLEAHVYTAISEFVRGYSELYDSVGYVGPYRAFMTAAYKTMAQIQDSAIQEQLSSLIADIRKNGGKVTEQTTEKFECITKAISNYLSTSKK